ncbi:MAG: MBL fold metallo-hydrolase [Desulfobacteraceae bacterium]|nr:MBL fold metallo-hydrolase [Desulfobacteraceae bacterium]
MMSFSSGYRKIEQNLYLVTLPVPINGFENFITSWIYTGGPTVVIDPGPACATAHLLSVLEQINAGQPGLILLTHIHIDHAGGTGALATAFPGTPVICHPKAVNHLVDPKRLWQGSVQTLGDVALAYGPIGKVSQSQITASDQFNHPAVQAIETLGHSPHHVSYKIGKYLFLGETGGVCLTLPDGSYYLRPATPPRFFMETCLNSIDKLIDLCPGLICYGHMGLRSDGMAMLKKHRDQLLHWLDLIRPWHQHQADDQETQIQACCDHLLANDPQLTGFQKFSEDQQVRERGFLINSIKGYWGYLESCNNGILV